MKWATIAVYTVAGLAVFAVIAWLYHSLHKDIGKATVTHTNAVVTNQALATNAEVEKKANNAVAKIETVQRRVYVQAQSVKANPGVDRASYDAWINSLCANDIYKGFAECTGTGGK